MVNKSVPVNVITLHKPGKGKVKDEFQQIAKNGNLLSKIHLPLSTSVCDKNSQVQVFLKNLSSILSFFFIFLWGFLHSPPFF